MKDNQQYYGTVTRILHWLMAAGYAFMLYTVIAWNINKDNFSLIGIHKSVGFCLLVLAIIRIIWALCNRKNRPHNATIAHIGHGVLYLLMLAVPTVAMLRQYGAARGALEVFGLTVMAKAPEKIEWMAQIGNVAHGKLGWLMFAMVVGHVLAAIWHQIRGEKIINRMAGPHR